MRISLDVRHLALPGVGRFATELDRALGRRPAGAPDVVGILPRGRARGWLGEAAFEDPPAAETVRPRSHPFGPAEQVELPRVLRSYRVDLHHSTFLTVPFAAQVPVVLTVHDLFPLVHPEHSRSRAAWAYYKLALPAAVRRATATVAVSEFTAAEMRRVLGIEADVVIGHGVDHGAWGAAAKAAGAGDEDDRAGALLGAEPYILYVGTAKAHKNLITLLRAHAGGGRGRELPRLVLAGPSAPEVEGLAPGTLGSGRVRALGRVPDRLLPHLYRRASALAMPSLYEGVGLAALEAMSFGVPVVAADAPGLRDTVGDAAWLAPPTDPGAWAEALGGVLTDDERRHELVERGRHCAARHSWDDTADSYVNLYRSVLGR